MFINFKIIIYLAIISSISGCATVTPEQKAKWEETVPICFSKFDCDVKWSAARRWVQSNAGYKIQIYSDDLIETYNPLKNNPKIAVSVSKNPLGKLSKGDEISSISVRIFCGNMFGCNPPVNQAILSFNTFVSQMDVNDPNCYTSLYKNIDTPKLGFISYPYQESRIVVLRVCSNSPASRAGIKVHDVIVKFNNKNIHNTKDYNDAMGQIKFGQKVYFEVLRNNISKTLIFAAPTQQEASSLVPSTETKTSEVSLSIEQKLEALSRLLNKGIINQEEFNIKKKELLNDL